MTKQQAKRLLLPIFALAALGLGALASLVVGRTHIDIGLDLLAPGLPPYIMFRDRHDNLQTIPMDKIPQEGAFMVPAYYDLNIQAHPTPGSKEASEIRILFFGIPDAESGTQRPEGAWRIRNNYYVDWSAPVDENTQIDAPLFHWSRWDYGGLTLTLSRPNKVGGIVTVGTPEWTETWNTFRASAEEPSQIDISIPPQRWGFARYHARVPRSALRHLSVDLGGREIRDIRRLYVGTLRPKEFTPQPELEHRFSPLRYGPWWSVTDDWNPSLDSNGGIVFSNLSVIEQGGVATFLFATALAFLLLAVGALAVPYMCRLCTSTWNCSATALDPAIPPVGFSWRFFLGVFVFFVLSRGIWLVAFWPGIGGTDELDLFMRARGDLPLSDAHGLANILLARLILGVRDHYSALGIVNVLLLASVSSYAFSLLKKWGAPTVALILGILFMALTTRNAYIVLSPGKDANYTIVVAFLTVLLAHVAVDRRAGEGITAWLLLGVALFLCAVVRHNGLAILVGMAVILPVCLLRRWRALVLTGAACAICYLAWIGFLLFLDDERRDDEHTARFKAWFLAQKMVPPVYLDLPVNAAEYETIARVDQFYVDRKLILNRERFHAGWPQVPSVETAENAKAIWLSLLLRYPLIYTQRWFHLHNYLFVPWAPHGSSMSGVIRGLALSAAFKDKYDMEIQSLWPRAAGVLSMFHALNSRRELAFIVRPALHLWLILVSAIALLVSFRDLRVVLPHFPVLLHTLGLFLVNANVQYRYQQPLRFIAAFLLVYSVTLLLRKRASRRLRQDGLLQEQHRRGPRPEIPGVPAT